MSSSILYLILIFESAGPGTVHGQAIYQARDLVSSSLPESSPRSRTNIRPIDLACPIDPPPATAAKEDNESREEQDNHRRQNSPHAQTVIGMAASAIAIDVVLDNARPHEIRHHDDKRDEECHC